MQLFDFNQVVYKHKLFRTSSNGLQNGTSQQARNKLAIRDNEIFYAVENVVRCGSLSASLDYKLLNLPIVQFQITELVINSSKTLLAIVGENRLVVCDLPPRGFMELPEKELKIRCRDVGASFLEVNNTVKKAIWNPIHRYDASIVVLTSDNVLRSFDLIKSYETPDQEIPLTSKPTGENTFDMTFDDFEAVSIAFGTSSDPRGRLTLYVLSREGDIYALCPFVPSSFVLTQRELEDLFDSAVASEYEYRHGEISEMVVRKHYKNQLDWSSDVWKQASTSVVETRQSIDDGSFEEYYVLESPKDLNTSRLAPSLQGPFSLNPYPEEFYYTEGVDIATIDNGACTIVCTTYSNGSILIAAQLHSVDMNWSVSEVSLDLSLVVIESVVLQEVVDFKLPSGSLKPTISVPSYSNNVFHILNSHFAHRIDISPWSEILRISLEDNDPEGLEFVSGDTAASNVTRLINVQNDGSLTRGIIDVVSDRKYTLAVTRDHVWLEACKPEQSVTLSRNLEAMVLNSGADSEPAIEQKRVKTHLDEPFEVDKLFTKILSSRIPNPKQTISLTDTISFNVDTLQYFNNVGEYFSKQLAMLQEIGLAMRNRLIDQRCELHRQLLNMKNLNTQILTLKKSNPAVQAHNVVERQLALESRAKKLLENLNKAGSKPVLQKSDQEKKWAEELERLKSQIAIPQGLESRVKTALAQARLLLEDKKFQDSEARRLSSSKLPSTGTTKGSVSLSASKPNGKVIAGLDAQNSLRLKMLVEKETDLVNTAVKLMQDLLNETAKEIKGLS